jgi:hypothetical protein
MLVSRSALGCMLIHNVWRLQVLRRIVASFLLYALYAPHSMDLNPFLSAIRQIFVAERQALRAAMGSSTSGASALASASGREAFVWALWQILQGHGMEVRLLSFAILQCYASFLLDICTVLVSILPNADGAFQIAAHSAKTLAQMDMSLLSSAADLILPDEGTSEGSSRSVHFAPVFITDVDRTFSANSEFSNKLPSQSRLAPAQTPSSILPTRNGAREPQDPSQLEASARGAALILDSRKRVLTLNEQKVGDLLITASPSSIRSYC